MADRGIWFKLWGICLNDQDLQNLSLENWARWARLGTYIKVHGKNGKIRFRTPFNAILDLFKCTNMDEVRAILTLLPHVTVGNGSDSVTLEIQFNNWYKYQVDSSSERVKRFRKSVTLLEEKRSRREKKRANSIPFSSTSKPLAGPYGG